MKENCFLLVLAFQGNGSGYVCAENGKALSIGIQFPDITRNILGFDHKQNNFHLQGRI